MLVITIGVRICKFFTIGAEIGNSKINIINPAMSVLHRRTPDFIEQWAGCRGQMYFNHSILCITIDRKPASRGVMQKWE